MASAFNAQMLEEKMAGLLSNQVLFDQTGFALTD